MQSILKKSKSLLPILIGLIFLTSCEDEDTKEAFGFILGFFIFLGGTILTSVPAIVLSAVSISTKNKAVIILAIVFTFLSTIFLVAETNLFMEAADQGDKNTIIIFPAITFLIIVLCVALIIIGFKRRASGFISDKLKPNTEALDEIIQESNDSDVEHSKE